jgi:hypothetical protein
VTDSQGTQHKPDTLDPSESALKFKVPCAGAFEVSIDGSENQTVNLPDPWWWQGDSGNASIPGGWLRVFGRSIGDPVVTIPASRLEVAIGESVSKKDFDTARELLVQLESESILGTAAAASRRNTRIRLTPTSGEQSSEPIEITATPSNTSEYQALFQLPKSLATGTYTAEISNGLISPATKSEWVQMEMFSTPAQPRDRAVTIAAPFAWKETVFTVDCEGATPEDLFSRPCGWVGARSSTQLDAALAKAKANGGGIVYLPRGQYYVDGPLVIPHGTRLRGEGAELVSIVFREDDICCSPKPGYIYANRSDSAGEGEGGGVAWAVEDLSIYITHHYNSVFYVHPYVTDFTLQRVRVRAAAWAMLSDPQMGESGRGNRVANFSRTDVGEVVYLNGNNNFRIVDNDVSTGLMRAISTGLMRAVTDFCIF